MSYDRTHRARRRQKILDLLAAGPADVHQLAAAVHMTKQNMHTHLKRIRAEPVRVIRIDHWIDEASDARKYPRPHYALGSEPDAPKPCPLHKRREKTTG